MIKKFPAEDIRKLTDDEYVYDLGIKQSNISGDLKLISEGEWVVWDLETHHRETILQEISTSKYYVFEEEADVAIDTFINIWENYPNIKEVECHEVISERKVITIWKKIQESSNGRTLVSDTSNDGSNPSS